MDKRKPLLFSLATLLLLFSLILMILSLGEELFVIKLLGLTVGIISFGVACSCFYFIASGKRKRKVILKHLNEEEQKLVNEAIDLVSRVDESFEISKFNTYRVDWLRNGKFVFNEAANSLNLLIPFKKYLRYGNDICFMAIVHEILHSQNMKNNEIIFQKNFLEGLNQLLTVWLIENYEFEREIPEKVTVFKFKFKNNKSLVIEADYKIYEKEVNMVSQILKEADVDMKEVFLNYVDFEPEYFRKFVPAEYFIK